MHFHLLHHTLPSHYYSYKHNHTHARLDPLKSGNLEPLVVATQDQRYIATLFQLYAVRLVSSLSPYVHHATADGGGNSFKGSTINGSQDTKEGYIEMPVSRREVSFSIVNFVIKFGRSKRARIEGTHALVAFLVLRQRAMLKVSEEIT